MDNHAAPKQRIAYLDLLRVIGAYLFILHQALAFIRLNEAAPAVRFICQALQVFSTAAAPVFLMISGCVLLPKADNVIKIISRTGRIVAALVLFSLVHAVLNVYRGTAGAFSVSTFLTTICRSPIVDSFWYLYVYAGLLIMLPLLQKLTKAMTKDDFIYYFTVSVFACTVWPLIVEFTPVPNHAGPFALPLVGSSLCYLFLGYALHRIPREKLCAPVLLVIAAAAAISGAVLMNITGSKNTLLSIASLPVLVCSACLFLLARCITLCPKAAGAVHPLGRCTFGCYLLADFFLALCTPFYHTLSGALGQIPAFMVYHLLMFALAMAVTWLLRRIPDIREIL